ncbi:MAG: ral secretion pathway protein [Verrucomicrobiota bacterium]
MKNIHLILILVAGAIGPNLRAQAPTPPPPTPDAEMIAREKAAFAAARAAAAAAATNNPRTLPTPVLTPAPGTTLPSAATRPAPAAFPVLPTPPLPTAGGVNTNRPGMRFTPANTAGTLAPPVAPIPGVGAAAAGPTNVTAAAIRAAAAGQTNLAAGNAAGAPEEVFPPGLLKFSDADINPILDIYQELTGRTVLKAPSLPAAKITFKTQTPLTRSEAIGALETVLAMNSITMVPQGTKFVKAVPQAQAFSEGKEFDNLGTNSDWQLYPESATMVTHVVQLKNALPNDLIQILQPFAKMPQSILTVPSTSMLIIRDYAENAKRMLELIEKVDVVPVQDFIDVVIPIKYALAADIQQVLSTLTAGGGGGGTTVGRQQSNTGLSSGGGGLGGNRGGVGGFGGTGLNQPGYNPNNPYGAQQQGGALGGAGAPGAGGRSSFAQRLNQIVNRAATGTGDIFVLGQTKIIADERTNSLLIFASRQDLQTISNIIDKLDVVLAQVVIEAVIMEVNLNNNLEYGMNYVQTKPTTVGDVFTGAGAIKTIPFLGLNNVVGGGGTGSNSIGDGFTYVASFMNFDAAITALAGDGRGKILQRPRIQTSHAVEANLFVGQSRPYPSSSSSGGIYGGYNQIQQLQIGVTLSVLPLINHDGLVVMDIRQKVESYDGDVIIQSVGAVPITSQKEANAKVSVRDRETVMLGGFISNQKNKSHGGVPILKDIPILGRLFSSTKETEDRRELIVLIRPTVLPTPDVAATFAKQERAKMPATKEAEQDFNESERKLLEETDKRMLKKENIYKREGFSR